MTRSQPTTRFRPRLVAVRLTAAATLAAVGVGCSAIRSPIPAAQATPLLTQARAAEQSGRLVEAERLYGELLQVDPSNSAAKSRFIAIVETRRRESAIAARPPARPPLADREALASVERQTETELGLRGEQFVTGGETVASLDDLPAAFPLDAAVTGADETKPGLAQTPTARAEIAAAPLPSASSSKTTDPAAPSFEDFAKFAGSLDSLASSSKDMSPAGPSTPAAEPARPTPSIALAAAPNRPRVAEAPAQPSGSLSMTPKVDAFASERADEEEMAQLRAFFGDRPAIAESKTAAPAANRPPRPEASAKIAAIATTSPKPSSEGLIRINKRQFAETLTVSALDDGTARVSFAELSGVPDEQGVAPGVRTVAPSRVESRTAVTENPRRRQVDAVWSSWQQGSQTDRVVAELCRLLREANGERDESSEQAIAAALGEMRQAAEPALPTLRRAMIGAAVQSQDSVRAIRLAEAIVRIDGDDETARKALVSVLRNGNGTQRVAAAAALGRSSKLAVPFLARALNDESEPVRAAAALALGRHGRDAKSARRSLQTAATFDTAVVREAAKTALRHL